MSIINTLFIITLLMLKHTLTMVVTHFKCRGGVYPRSAIERFPVPDDKVLWTVEYKHYTPIEYTSPGIKEKPWADPDIGNSNFEPKWNEIDGNVDRRSFHGTYEIINGRPQNPIGRTGITGRGVLGRWGPNHAADPVVTRWKPLNADINEKNSSDKQILQFVAVKRGDTGEWALPGGMVDPGEKVTATAVREFQEEAMNSLSQDLKNTWTQRLKDFFTEGEIVYKGYVDDWRNTDNSWMETVAYNFHDESGAIVGAIALNAGDDAVGVRWVDITPDIKLYASHERIVKEVLKKHLQNSKVD